MDRRNLLLGGAALAAGSAASAPNKQKVGSGSQADAVAATGRRQTIFQEADGEQLVKRNGKAGIVRTLASRADDLFDLRDVGCVRRQDTAADCTALIQAALDDAAEQKINTVYCEESYRVNGTIIMPSGMALVSAGGSTAYYDDAVGGYPARPAAGFYKPSTGTNGPLLIMGIGSTVIGLTFEHQKVGGATPALGGVVQMGASPVTNNCNRTILQRVTVVGHEIDYEPGGTAKRRIFGAGTPDCALLVFPATPLGTQRYGHIVEARLSNGYYGVWMGNQANANVINVDISQCWRHLWLDGTGGEVLGNEITGMFTNSYPMPTTKLTAAGVSALSNAARAIALQDVVWLSATARCQMNKFSGYTELGGRTFNVTGEARTYFNDASGIRTNEIYPDHFPVAWALPLRNISMNNVRGNVTRSIPYSDSFDTTFFNNHEEGSGVAIQRDDILTDNLPQLGGLNIGVNANSRVLARWQWADTVSKLHMPIISGTIRLEVEAAGEGVGVHVSEFKFYYRVTNKTTGAGQLTIQSVYQEPASPNNYLCNLYFINGKSGGGSRSFAFAAAFGNVGAVTAANIAISLDMKVRNAKGRVSYYYKQSAMYVYCVNVVAEDVADAMSMMTIGSTAV